MTDSITVQKPKTVLKAERPKMYKVILLNDDYTPRDFVVMVLKKIFRMTEGEALAVMMTAHQKGASVVAVFTKEIAEEKARQGTESGERFGYPLAFTTEKED
ncbi:MAG: ATP-dependent Clp protease adaptor ClpS [Pseudomonadota bacterium]